MNAPLSLRLASRLLLAPGVVLLAAVPVSGAWLVGFNTDVHNGTGQDAYDFHVQGIVEGSTIATTYISSVDVVPFDWGWDGATWNGNHFEGGWSGTTAVATCQTIHIGMYVPAGLNYMYDIVGWWTDAAGNKINPLAGAAGPVPGTFYSDVPILGFGVDDATSRLTLQNSTTNPIVYRNLSAALFTSVVPLPSLNQASLAASGVPFLPLSSAGSIDPGAEQQITLTDFGMTALGLLPDTQSVVIQGEVFDATIGPSGDYRWFAESHQVIPEPATYAWLAGLGALATALVRRCRR